MAERVSKRKGKPAERRTSDAPAQPQVPRASEEREFVGFSPQGVAFLAELRAMNDRDWFKHNQERYESTVREPALAFIRAMAPHLRSLSPHIVARASRVGGSLMRIQRDTRFGMNRAPYKTNIGIQFRNVSGKDVHAPGFYVHIDPDRVFVAAGLWHPEPEPLRLVRQRIVEHAKAYQQAIGNERFCSRYQLGGETLKRAPKGFEPNHPMIDTLKRKDHIAVMELDHEAAYSSEFIVRVADGFAAAAPLLRFLHQALGLAF